MAKITFTDKNKAGTGAVKQWRDSDANEVKASVNALYDNVESHGVFAYLSEPANTVINEAAVYQYIVGTFENPVLSGFELIADPEPGIVCTCDSAHYFEIDWHASVSANVPNTTVNIGIAKNGTVIAGSAMPLFCKAAAEPYNFSGTCVVELTTDDLIQLMITSDGTGDAITVVAFTTTIRNFYLI